MVRTLYDDFLSFSYSYITVIVNYKTALLSAQAGRRPSLSRQSSLHACTSHALTRNAAFNCHLR